MTCKMTDNSSLFVHNIWGRLANQMTTFFLRSTHCSNLVLWKHNFVLWQTKIKPVHGNCVKPDSAIVGHKIEKAPLHVTQKWQVTLTTSVDKNNVIMTSAS